MIFSTIVRRGPALLLMLVTIGNAMMFAPAGDKPLSVSDSAVSVERAPVPTPATKVWRERQPIRLNDWLAGSLAIAPDGKTLLVGGTGGHSATFDIETGILKKMDKPTKGFVAVAYGETNDETLRVSETESLHRYMRTDGTQDSDSANLFKQYWNAVICQTTSIEANNGLRVTRRLAMGSQGEYRDHQFSWIETVNNSQILGGRTSKSGGGEKAGQIIDPYAVPIAADPNNPRMVKEGYKHTKTDTYYAIVYTFDDNIVRSLGNHIAPVVSAAWSKDGSTIVTGDAVGTVIIWDAKTLKETHRFNFDKQRIAAIDCTKDGKRIAIATISNDKTQHTENIYVWDIANPPPTFTPIAKPREKDQIFAGVACIKFTPDGQTLAACFCNIEHAKKLAKLGGEVRIWDLQPKR